MARFYSNENFPLPVADELRNLGHNVLTIQQTGHSGQSLPDETVLAFARAEERILLTLNRRHFIRLHQSVTEHAGIVACTLDLDFKALAKRIHEAVEAEKDMRGKLLRINRPPTA